MGLSEFISDLMPNESGNGGGRPDARAGAVVHECRECGTTVSADTTQCPTCGASEIVEYPVE